MGLQIDWYQQLILITSPTISVSMQTAHDFIEDAMASPRGSLEGDILKPEGKIEDPNNPGIFSQIIVVLNSPWQFQFWQGSGYTRLYGGKLVGGLNDQPFKATGLAGDITVLESPVDGVTSVTETGVSGLTTEESDALLQNTADLSTMTASMTSVEGDIGIIQTDIADLQGDVVTLTADVGVIKVDITDIKADILVIKTSIGLIEIDIADIQVDMAFIKAIESGEWKIENNQMIFYDLGSVEIARFNLFNSSGSPADEDVYRRVPV